MPGRKGQTSACRRSRMVGTFSVRSQLILDVLQVVMHDVQRPGLVAGADAVDQGRMFIRAAIVQMPRAIHRRDQRAARNQVAQDAEQKA